ncbi:MAG TPA: hemolysin family protein [Aestuariivirgaceae bacterium]|jgi:putative hemolysin
MLTLELAFILLLIIINGVLAMSELAVVSARPARLKSMAERGVRGARRALALASEPGRFLSTVQIGITLVGVLAGAISGTTLAERLKETLVEAGVPVNVAEPLAFGFVVTAVTYVSLTLGELVPKQLALRNAERLACRVAPSMMLLAKISSPFVWLLNTSGNLVLKLLGQRHPSARRVTDEEIRTLIAEAESVGLIEPEERSMIAGVMRLGDRQVQAVMTPRREIESIDLSGDLRRMRKTILSSSHSRLIVIDGSPDTVVGVINAKDLLDACLRRRKFDPRPHIKLAPIVPETMDALEVVQLLKGSPVHMALVHDEYGHFQGLVTSADILETIVGAFRTEEGPPEKHIVRRDDGSFLVSGDTPIEELADALGLAFSEPRDFHTAAGFILDRLQRIPEVGEHFDEKDWCFEVVDLDGKRIDKLLVTKPRSTDG